MRVVFTPLAGGCLSAFEDRFKDIAGDFTMDWQICDLTRPVKTLILVSRPDHCLNDLLYRWRTKHLPIDITGIVSNHEDHRTLIEQHGLPFHYLPVDPGNKTEQEKEIEKIVQQSESELIVLARYMQILSEDMCSKFKGRMINIHHSFLPGFKGARPYHQAYERGVKIIGATAHFVTPDLDEGPIIAQDVVPVDHAQTPETMQAMGQDTESRVLARAVRLYAERRIFLQNPRTIIL